MPNTVFLKNNYFKKEQKKKPSLSENLQKWHRVCRRTWWTLDPPGTDWDPGSGSENPHSCWSSLSTVLCTQTCNACTCTYTTQNTAAGIKGQNQCFVVCIVGINNIEQCRYFPDILYYLLLLYLSLADLLLYLSLAD